MIFYRCINSQECIYENLEEEPLDKEDLICPICGYPLLEFTQAKKPQVKSNFF